MATTRVLAFKKSDDADTAVGYWTSLGYKVVRVGPTDRIELEGEAPPTIIWESGNGEDWHLIVATKDGVITG